MSTKGMIVSRLIDDKCKDTNYGVSNIGEHAVIVDLNTRYVNGTKFASLFKTRENMPKELFHWLNDNKDKVTQLTNFVKEHVSDELVDDNISYEVKKLTPEGPSDLSLGLSEGSNTSLNIIYTDHKMNIKEYNEKYNSDYYSLNNLVKGTYIHMYLCVRLLEWLDKERYSAHANIIANFYTSNALINAVIRNMLTPDQVRQVPAILDNNDDVSTSSANNKDLCQVSKNKDIYKAKLDEAHRYILANKHTITMKDIIAEEACAFTDMLMLYTKEKTLTNLRKNDTIVRNIVTNDALSDDKKQCVLLAKEHRGQHVYIHIHGGQRPYITKKYNKYNANPLFINVCMYFNIGSALSAIIQTKKTDNIWRSRRTYPIRTTSNHNALFTRLEGILDEINEAYITNIGNTVSTC